MHRFLTASLPLLLSACALGQVGAVLHPSVSGNLAIRTSDGAETVWKPDRCASGDLSYFLGFDFVASTDQNRLRVLREPTGNVIATWNATTLRASDCDRLDLEIHDTGWRVNDVREFGGRIDLQCRTPDGTRIAGYIGVDHCH